MTPMLGHTTPPISQHRRHCLQAALATAVGLKLSTTPAQAATSAPGPSASPGLGAARCTVSAARLDALLAEAFPRFNSPALLSGFDAARHGARHDVELHRLMTEVTVPEIAMMIPYKVRTRISEPLRKDASSVSCSWSTTI